MCYVRLVQINKPEEEKGEKSKIKKKKTKMMRKIEKYNQ